MLCWCKVLQYTLVRIVNKSVTATSRYSNMWRHLSWFFFLFFNLKLVAYFPPSAFGKRIERLWWEQTLCTSIDTPGILNVHCIHLNQIKTSARTTQDKAQTIRHLKKITLCQRFPLFLTASLSSFLLFNGVRKKKSPKHCDLLAAVTLLNSVFIKGLNRLPGISVPHCCTIH